MGSHQQTTCDSQGNDSHDDKKQGGDPFWGKPRRDAGPVSSMDCLTLPHQAHSECSRRLPGVDPVRVGDAGDGEDIGAQAAAVRSGPPPTCTTSLAVSRRSWLELGLRKPTPRRG